MGRRGLQLGSYLSCLLSFLSVNASAILICHFFWHVFCHLFCHSYLSFLSVILSGIHSVMSSVILIWHFFCYFFCHSYLACLRSLLLSFFLSCRLSFLSVISSVMCSFLPVFSGFLLKSNDPHTEGWGITFLIFFRPTDDRPTDRQPWILCNFIVLCSILY